MKVENVRGMEPGTVQSQCIITVKDIMIFIMPLALREPPV